MSYVTQAHSLLKKISDFERSRGRDADFFRAHGRFRSGGELPKGFVSLSCIGEFIFIFKIFFLGV